ncbi:MAG: SDR family oxidoreductase [Dehalococcoidia bacterium]
MTTGNPDRKLALITGASSGIGAVFATQLAQRRHDLILVARRRDRLEQLAAELSEKQGVTAEVIEADLAGEAGVSAVEERLRSPGVDVLVNSAGFGSSGQFADLPLKRELEEIDLNVRALVRLSHAALGPMVQRRRGGIVNIASTGAFQPVPYMATYAATKAFVLSFSEALHEEVKEHGVSVTALCPGPVRTEFQQVAGVDEGRVPSMAWVSADNVVKSALWALQAHRASTVPGLVNKGGMLTAKFAPRFVARRVAGSMFKRFGGA